MTANLCGLTANPYLLASVWATSPNSSLGTSVMAPHRAAAVTAPGIMVLALICTIGVTSGAHLNPAVTVAFAARGHFPGGG